MGTTPARSITVRRLDQDYEGQPHWFVAGDPLRSHIAAMLSAVFPEGENFFVRAVRNYRDQVTDPELKRQVTGFIGQEALHSREHRAFNEQLDRMGYPTGAVDRRVKRDLDKMAERAPQHVQLAITAALEHYTATLAEVILRDEDARNEFSTPETRSLVTWHALEESEHKSVAFDVFQAVDGRHGERVRAMVAVHIGFGVFMAACVAYSLARDRQARRHPLTVLRSIGRMWTHPFFQPSVVRRLRDYNRRDFHPDDHDTADIIDAWRHWYEAERAAS